MPRYANHVPAYNMLREMVVTHTGLEVGAVIHLSYTIHTQSDFMPAFMGDISIGGNSPIKSHVIKVNIPADQELQHKTFNIRTAPEITDDGKIKTYTWIFNDVKILTHEPHSNAQSVPRVIFSAAKDLHRVYDKFVNQEAVRMQSTPEIASLVKDLTKDAKSDIDRVLKLQHYVVHDLATFNVPLKDIGYRIKTSNEVLASMGGTQIEKVLLLCTMIREAGVNAIPVVVFPEKLFDKEIGNLLTADDFLIQVNPRKRQTVLYFSY